MFKSLLSFFSLAKTKTFSFHETSITAPRDKCRKDKYSLKIFFLTKVIDKTFASNKEQEACKLIMR